MMMIIVTMLFVTISMQLFVCIHSYQSTALYRSLSSYTNHHINLVTESSLTTDSSITTSWERERRKKKRRCLSSKVGRRGWAMIQSSSSSIDTINGGVESSNTQEVNRVELLYNEVMEILSTITDPYDGESIVEGGMVSNIIISDGSSSVSFDLLNRNNRNTFMEDIKNLCLLELSMLEWVSKLLLIVQLLTDFCYYHHLHKQLSTSSSSSFLNKDHLYLSIYLSIDNLFVVNIQQYHILFPFDTDII